MMSTAGLSCVSHCRLAWTVVFVRDAQVRRDDNQELVAFDRNPIEEKLIEGHNISLSGGPYFVGGKGATLESEISSPLH